MTSFLTILKKSPYVTNSFDKLCLICSFLVQIKKHHFLKHNFLDLFLIYCHFPAFYQLFEIEYSIDFIINFRFLFSKVNVKVFSFIKTDKDVLNSLLYFHYLFDTTFNSFRIVCRAKKGGVSG